MLRVHYEQWGQCPEQIRFLAQEAPHRRTRERLMALYEVAQGRNATQVARQFGRRHTTVQQWVKDYNRHGPTALQYRRSGGRPPFALKSKRPSPSS